MILVIDNYDSFTYNLVDYLGKLSSLPLEVHRNDRITVEEIGAKAPRYIVVSPGPKWPKDAGVSKATLRAFAGKIPMLGVCLGHQALGEEFGCEITHARNLMHGKTSRIVHRDDPLFAGVPNPFQATRYHSLVISSQKLAPEILPLAFSLDDMEIMAVKHRDFPVYGVQFHPESIYTPHGLTLIENFLKF